MYTIVTSNVQLDAGTGWTKWSSKSYFHPQDIAVLLAHPQVKYLQVENAIIKGKECLVLIGVTDTDPNTDEVTGRLDKLGDIIVPNCPPYNKKGGIFDGDPD